jgi:hypothetical protein
VSPRTFWSPPEQKASGPSPVSTITPTSVSSRARSSASEISISVSGLNALRTSGRLIVIFAIPSAVSKRMSSYSPAGCQSAPGRIALSVVAIGYLRYEDWTSG